MEKKEFERRKELLRLKMETREYERETERLKFEWQRELQRIKSAEIRKSMERKYYLGREK